MVKMTMHNTFTVMCAHSFQSRTVMIMANLDSTIKYSFSLTSTYSAVMPQSESMFNTTLRH